MSKAKGDIAEATACEYLYDNGYTILEQNFHSRFGEIDIIATKDDTLHFVEVKSGENYEKAIQNITPSKISKLIKTADIYMKKNNYIADYQLDALVVVDKQCWHVENITI